MAENKHYPNDFFTFWNNDTTSIFYYDNGEHGAIWDYEINFYSIDPVKAESVLMEAKKQLKAAGFIVNGCGYDAPSDTVTHIGRGINVKYLQYFKEAKNDE